MAIQIAGGITPTHVAEVDANAALRTEEADIQGGVYARATFGAKIYCPRITTALAAGSVLWSFRNLPAVGTNCYWTSGFITIGLDTALATLAEVGIELVRFTAATPSGGTQLTPPSRFDTGQAPSVGPDIRAASAIAGLTVTGVAIDATTQALASLTMTGNAGAMRTADLTRTLRGQRFQPGEGILIRTNPAAWPIGATLGGMMAWGEA